MTNTANARPSKTLRFELVPAHPGWTDVFIETEVLDRTRIASIVEGADAAHLVTAAAPERVLVGSYGSRDLALLAAGAFARSCVDAADASAEESITAIQARAAAGSAT